MGVPDLRKLPEDIERELYAAFQLQDRYYHPSRRVTLRVTIDGEPIPRLTAASGYAGTEVRGRVVATVTG